MTDLVQIVSALGALVIVIAVVLLARRQHIKRKQAGRIRDRWIVSTLLSITNEADRKRLNVHATPKIDIDQAFTELRRLAHEYPHSMTDRIADMEKRWHALGSQLAELTNQPTSSTLQSSLLTSKTSKLANDVGKLADEIQQQLEN